MGLIEQGLWVIFLLDFFLICCYQLSVYLGLGKKKKLEAISNEPLPLSVLIVAKNESHNIDVNLPHILSQNYPDFEVLWIDDHSEDDSLSRLKSISEPHLKLIEAPSNSKGKKSALAYGIQQAKNEHLVFIDADCYPATAEWLNYYNSAFQQGNNLVIGHGAFLKSKGLLNDIIRYENFWTAVQYLSRAVAAKPYMGVGRNMGYTKELFKKSSRFKNHSDLLSGDDDHFVNEIRNLAQVGTLLKPGSFTYSKAEMSWKDYFNQKRRHLKAGTRYRLSDRFRLFIGGFSIGLFFITFIALLAFGENLLLIFGMYMLRYLSLSFALVPIASRMKEKDLAWKVLYLEFAYIVLITSIGVSTWIRKVDTWK